VTRPRRNYREIKTASQFAEKCAFVLAFGWRSGSPLRHETSFEIGFSR